MHNIRVCNNNNNFFFSCGNCNRVVVLPGIIWLIILVASIGKFSEYDRPRRILVDTDVDADDVFALLYLLKQNRTEFDLQVFHFHFLLSCRYHVTIYGAQVLLMDSFNTILLIILYYIVSGLRISLHAKVCTE